MSLTLALSEWPHSDRKMWAALHKHGGPLDDSGAFSHLRATSLETLKLRYGRWLTWLDSAHPEQIALAPVERAELGMLTDWLEDLARTKPMTQLMFIDGVLRVLRAEAPKADWSRQLRLLAGLRRKAGKGDKVRKVGRVLSSKVLLETGIKYAEVDSQSATTTLDSMKRRRDGTMIAMLALIPIRRRAFASLQLGESLLVDDEKITIALSEDLTKTGVHWETVVPQPLIPLLHCYLTVVRPWFMARGNQSHHRLWVGKFGQPLGADYVGMRIGNVTKKLTGVRVSPHLFRDAAATTLSRISPQSARLIRPILAHSRFATAERHYIQADTIEAGRNYASLINKLKKDQR
jgi:integrase/recombinase XerD